MIFAELEISVDEIPFDTIKKEQRQSASDSRDLICVDVDAVGSGYRAIINGCEFELPNDLPTIEDAKRVTVQMAAGELTKAIGELLETIQ